MQSCDFCDLGIADLDGAVVPGPSMQAALEKGYRPSDCPHWPIMHDRAAGTLHRENTLHPDSERPVTEDAILFRWDALLRSPMKTWRLCNGCFSTLGPHLPTVVPHQGSYYDRYYETPDEMRFVVPINVSGLAIAAGYFGILAIFPLFIPVAILLGVLALIRLKKNEGKKLGGKGRAWFAIIMGITSLLLWAVLIAVMICG